MRYLIKNSLFVTLAAGMLMCVNTSADVVQREIPGDVTKVLVRDDAWQPENFKEGTVIPVVYAGDAEIFLDGIDSEPEWENVPEITVPLSFGSAESAQLKGLYTDP